MKKLYAILLILTMMLIPFNVMAEAEATAGNPTSLQQACSEEEIDYNHDYKTAEDKVNLYLFRGLGCSHCHEFLQYLESIIDEYGKYVNVITYEVWGNKENSALMEKVASKLEKEANGVPFIVIGEKTFSGYSSSLNEEIESLIKEEYEKTDRYDVMEGLNANTKVTAKNTKASSNNSSDIIILVVALAIIAGVVSVIVIARKQN